MRWMWLVVVLASASAEDFCEGYENEMEQHLEAMYRILRVFRESLFAVSADVVLGLRIATVIFGKIPESHKWTNDVTEIHQACEDVINGYVDRKFGQHTSSQNLIPHMLNKTLWENIVKDRGNVNVATSFQQLFSVNAELSDECFSDLFLRNCDVNSACFVENPESGFNYGTTHYLLFLQIAGVLNCGDGSFIASSKYLICGKMFRDIFSNVKTLHSPAELDIFLEGVVLCGIEGYEPFTSKEIQQFVKTFERSGCFRLEESNARIKKTDIRTIDQCHSHTNAVGFTALALFIKSLIEKCEF